MPHRRRIPYSIVAIGIVIACALMGVCVLQLFQSRADALDRASELRAMLVCSQSETSSATSSYTICLCRQRSTT